MGRTGVDTLPLNSMFHFKVFAQGFVTMLWHLHMENARSGQRRFKF